MEICWYHPRRWLPDQKKGTGFLTLMHQICKFYDISQSICGWPFLVSTKIGDYVNLSCQLSLWITFPSFGELEFSLVMNLFLCPKSQVWLVQILFCSGLKYVEIPNCGYNA
jgi:hypothetical protein